MTLSLDSNQSRYQIRSYQPGRIQINDDILNTSIIITPDELITDWPPQTLAELTSAMLLPPLKNKPDLLLIGTGSQLVFLAPAIYGHLLNMGIAVEVMSTRAACLTYTALSAENRALAAALIIS